jgi:hypothetical protein
MRNILLALLAVTFAWGLWADAASAQSPTGNFTRDRAYRHFLRSQSPHRTFSSLPQRYEWGWDTPLESARFYHVTPFHREVISHRGHERFVGPSYSGWSIERRAPVVVPPAPWRPW